MLPIFLLCLLGMECSQVTSSLTIWPRPLLHVTSWGFAFHGYIASVSCSVCFSSDKEASRHLCQ